MKDWKSSTIGLSVLMTAIVGSVHFDAAGHLLMTQKDWFGLFVGCIAAIVGMLQKDAGTETVQNAQGKIVSEPSHEVPDNPSSTVVK